MGRIDEETASSKDGPCATVDQLMPEEICRPYHPEGVEASSSYPSFMSLDEGEEQEWHAHGFEEKKRSEANIWPQNLANSSSDLMAIADQMNDLLIEDLYKDEEAFASMMEKKGIEGTSVTQQWVVHGKMGWKRMEKKRLYYKAFTDRWNARFEIWNLEGWAEKDSQRSWQIPGKLNGVPVSCGVDTGAQNNFISEDIARMLKVHPKAGTAQDITLGSGNIVRSPGMTALTWKFEGELTPYRISCSIIPGSTTNLLLGASFLRLTQTLTKFKQRLRVVIRPIPRIFRVNFLGDEKQRLRGYLDGQFTMAMPDTGSDVMLISESFARKRGFKVESACSDQLELELQFGDGSRSFTDGIVKDVDWTFYSNKRTVRCDFYVLKGLPVDVLLSNEFLFDQDVFSEDEVDLTFVNNFRSLTEFFNIRLITKYSKELEKLEEEYLDDCERPSLAFSPHGEYVELVRRDKIRKLIESLNTIEQDEARREEEQRTQIWNMRRKAYMQSPRAPAENGTEQLISTSGSQPGLFRRAFRSCLNSWYRLRIARSQSRAARSDIELQEREG